MTSNRFIIFNSNRVQLDQSFYCLLRRFITQFILDFCIKESLCKCCRQLNFLTISCHFIYVNLILRQNTQQNNQSYNYYPYISLDVKNYQKLHFSKNNQCKQFKYFRCIDKQMKTPCAFHQGQIITQFCKCSTCLLPLCQQCLPIHRKQHNSIIEPIQLTSIQSIVQQINLSINHQFKYVDAIAIETINKYRESDQYHKKIFVDIMHNKDVVMNSVHKIYQNIFIELENNARRRELWIRDFNQSVIQLKQELNSMVNSLIGQKYLRTVIMWNRMKPNEAIQEISKKAEKKWVVPSFVGCNQQTLTNFVKNNINLKVLEIEGDSGVKKILQIIRVLRYGQQQSTSSQSFKTSSVQLIPQSPNIQSLKQNLSLQLPLSPTNSQLGNNGSYNQHLAPNQNIMQFNSPGRKNSHKKLQVLSSMQPQKIAKIEKKDDLYKP